MTFRESTPAERDAYADACRRATTGQGLDPLIAALAQAGIGHGLAQTGGFCMAVTIPVADAGTWALIGGPDFNGSPAGTFGAVFYPGQSWEEGPADQDEEEAVMQSERVLTADAVVALIRGGGRP